MPPKQLIFFSLLLLKYVSSEVENPILDLPNGQIMGRIATTFTNTTYYSFKKIPYAAPPLGELRFMPPQPVENWADILDADTDGVSCNQMQAIFPLYDTEDCLYVNVFTPQLPQENVNVSLAVMLFVYGGGFMSGSSIIADPDLFMDNGVILVSFDYRVGVFGFLSTEDDVIPGNNGLKDQLMAMRWTHDNIQLFGGDPDKITVFGHNEGAVSIAFQLLNPNAEGLFSGAILQSGTALLPTAIQRQARNVAFSFAASLNSTFRNSNDSQALLEFLQSLDPRGLALDAEAYYVEKRRTDIIDNIFVPVIEIENPDAIITQKMYGLFQAGNFLNVPTLIGLSSEEMSGFYTNPQVMQYFVTSWDTDLTLLVPTDMTIEDREERTEMGRRIRDIYTNGTRFDTDLGAGVRYSSDNFFNRGIIKHAELTSSFANTYFYQFSYNGVMGGFDTIYEGAESVGDSEIIPYLFCSGEICLDSVFPESDQLTRQRLLKIWTDFAKYLNPTPEPSDLLQNITWPLFSAETDDYFYVDINENLEIRNHPKGESYQRWTELYDSLNATDFDTY